MRIRRQLTETSFLNTNYENEIWTSFVKEKIPVTKDVVIVRRVYRVKVSLKLPQVTESGYHSAGTLPYEKVGDARRKI